MTQSVGFAGLADLGLDDVAREHLDLAQRDLLSVKITGDVGQLVRLVEDQHVGLGQYFAETFFFQRQIGKIQVMIDYQDVCVQRLFARL